MTCSLDVCVCLPPGASEAEVIDVQKEVQKVKAREETIKEAQRGLQARWTKRRWREGRRALGQGAGGDDQGGAEGGTESWDNGGVAGRGQGQFEGL